MPNKYYYFGCGERTGHYLFGERLSYVERDSGHHPYQHFFSGMDGKLVGKNNLPYQIVRTDFNGIEYSVFSFVDYSMDKRSGSNANFFTPWSGAAVVSNLDFEQMVRIYFPALYKRYASMSLKFSINLNDHLQESWTFGTLEPPS